MPFPAAGATIALRFANGTRPLLPSPAALALTYDPARNCFTLATTFDTLNKALGDRARALLGENTPPQDSVITITGTFIGNSSTQNPIDGAIIIQLKKDAP